MRLTYIALVYLCFFVFNSIERITKHEITEIECEDDNYKLFCANATQIEIKNTKDETHYSIKNGEWKKVYVKQCIHEITKNGNKIRECRPCYFKNYQEICKDKNYDVYCNVEDFENDYCKKIEYIVRI